MGGGGAGSGKPIKGLELFLMLGATVGLQASLKETVQLRALACVLELGTGPLNLVPLAKAGASSARAKACKALKPGRLWVPRERAGTAQVQVQPGPMTVPPLPPCPSSHLLSHLQLLKARYLILALDLGCPGFAQSIC